MRLVKFFVFLILLLLICIPCYWAAFVISENDSQGIIVHAFALLFYVFYFPSLYIFSWLNWINGWTFYGGLILDCIIYALVLERIATKIKQRKFKRITAK